LQHLDEITTFFSKPNSYNQISYIFGPLLYNGAYNKKRKGKYYLKRSSNKQVLLRNDETIISSISVTDIVFDVYLEEWNYRTIPKVKTWSYFLTIPK